MSSNKRPPADKPPPCDRKDQSTSYQVNDPEAFAKNLLRLMEDGSETLSGAFSQSGNNQGPFSQSGEMSEAAKSMGDVMQAWMREPEKLAKAQGDLADDYINLWSNSMRRLFGEEVEPVVEPARGDKRFKDPEWSDNPYFDFCKQAYLLSSNWAEELVDKTEGLDPHAKMKAEFHLRQITSALSPSNFPATNPEIMRETLSSNGKNLVEGMANLAKDMKSSGELMKISQSDVAAFEVGRDLAVTPGKVIFQNKIIQLIQYEPTTPKVQRKPLLIVPPWINKFYILDLRPEKSFIKYIVDQGFTVFVISWVNPDTDMRNTGFEDYMREGILAATKAVQKETALQKINILGYCVGGTLLSATLSYQAARGKTPFSSATFLTTQVDFSKAGDLLFFIDDDQLDDLEQLMKERGYLDGSRMANVFNMLRPKDLIWPYIVNNYMLGKKPMPFDLLYWNQDSTRLPAANHSFYLREFYHHNLLAKGGMKLDGVTLDVGKVKVPVFELAARDDHIAPPESVYEGAKLFSGPVEYVLSGSGHIAGVVNPPAKKKYQYWTNKMGEGALEEWKAGANEHPGSWWPHWIKWLRKHSGPKVEARAPGKVLGQIEDAPGSFVKAKN